MKEHIESFTKDLLKKEGKLARDKLAFSGKYAYTWPQIGGSRIGRKHANVRNSTQHRANKRELMILINPTLLIFLRIHALQTVVVLKQVRLEKGRKLVVGNTGELVRNA